MGSGRRTASQRFANQRKEYGTLLWHHRHRRCRVASPPRIEVSQCRSIHARARSLVRSTVALRCSLECLLAMRSPARMLRSGQLLCSAVDRLRISQRKQTSSKLDCADRVQVSFERRGGGNRSSVGHRLEIRDRYFSPRPGSARTGRPADRSLFEEKALLNIVTYHVYKTGGEPSDRPSERPNERASDAASTAAFQLTTKAGQPNRLACPSAEQTTDKPQVFRLCARIDFGHDSVANRALASLEIEKNRPAARLKYTEREKFV